MEDKSWDHLNERDQGSNLGEGGFLGRHCNLHLLPWLVTHSKGYSYRMSYIKWPFPIQDVPVSKNSKFFQRCPQMIYQCVGEFSVQGDNGILGIGLWKIRFALRAFSILSVRTSLCSQVQPRSRLNWTWFNKTILKTSGIHCRHHQRLAWTGQAAQLSRGASVPDKK